jgi:ubiquinone/menaquinone biosynthesis C-methylase UbiE
MDKDSHRHKVFFDVQHGLPRQGPGSNESTLRALSMCSGLPDRPLVLDIGCGPGMQTLALAKALDGSIVAVDNYQEYLGELKTRADVEGLAERIQIVAGDMRGLPFSEHSFDLVWAEGAAYILGFDKALLSWKKLLKQQGYIAVSELIWLRADPPAEVEEFFCGEYPAMSDIETNLAKIRDCGYEPIGHFTLPDAAWWKNYYTPLEAKLQSLAQKYTDDSVALDIIEMTRIEIEMRRRYAQSYGYEFFVAQASV